MQISREKIMPSGFDSGKKWDEFYNEGTYTLSFPSEQVLRGMRRLFPTGSEPRGLKILDWGCGNGRNMPAIMSVFPLPNEIHVIDISEVAVESALKGYGSRIKSAIVGSIEETGYPDETFDVLIDDGATHHTTGPDAAFREMHRVLKTGGKAVIGFMAAGSKWEGSPENSKAVVQCDMPGGSADVIFQVRKLGFNILHKEVWSRTSGSFVYNYLWADIEKAPS
jgi:ubiquinone/menaquinone biosynthesis C-methylase UbiE